MREGALGDDERLAFAPDDVAGGSPPFIRLTEVVQKQEGHRGLPDSVDSKRAPQFRHSYMGQRPSLEQTEGF
jgi:hypothetical protein